MGMLQERTERMAAGDVVNPTPGPHPFRIRFGPPYEFFPDVGLLSSQNSLRRPTSDRPMGLASTSQAPQQTNADVVQPARKT